MNTISRYAYNHIHSFEVEDGGLYNVYTFLYSRLYSIKMRTLHCFGKHSKNTYQTGMCGWCGEPLTKGANSCEN